MINLNDTYKYKYLNGEKQDVRIVTTFANNTTKTITSEYIKDGGLIINKTSTSSSDIELGSAIASELTLQLFDHDDSLSDLNFEGASLLVNLHANSVVPIGLYYVDEVSKSGKNITLVALDGMVKFDKPLGSLTYTTVQSLVNSVALACGIGTTINWSQLSNSSYSVATPTGENLTYRQLLIWCCQILGVCAYMNGSGNLAFSWYKDNTVADIDKLTPSNRLNSSIDANPITITGVQATINGTTYISGTDDYCIDISGNGLLNIATINTALSNIGNAVIGTQYYPFFANTLQMLWFEPFDNTVYVDADGNEKSVIITDVTYKLNGATALSAKGDTAQKKGYASQSAFTPQQSVIIEAVREQAMQTGNIDSRMQATIALNNAVNNGMMLHNTTVSGKTYYHNADTLADSTFICTANSNGFAFTNTGWNNGNPTWLYGISQDGNAVVNILSAATISADLITTGQLSADLITTGTLQSSDGDISIDFDNKEIDFGNDLHYDPTNGLQINTTVVVGAVDDALADYDFSDLGVSIISTSVTYQSSGNGTVVPSGTWLTTVPTVAKGQYLWTKTTVNYSDGNSTTSYSVSYSGTNGTDGTNGTNGTNGTDGKGIVSITTYYKANNSPTNAPTSGWTTTASNAGLSSTNRYLWSYSATAYTEGSPTTTTPYVLGVYGDKGDTGETGAAGQNGTNGRGITSITHQYYLSTSQSSVTGGSWSDTPQTYSANHYYWERDHIVWNDGSNPTDTTAVLSRGLNKAILDANEANTAIGNWCYENNKTIIDGSKIFTGSMTLDSTFSNKVFANTIAATGDITITQNAITVSALTSTEQNTYAQQLYGKQYSSLNTAQRFRVNSYGLAQKLYKAYLTQSKFKITDNTNTSALVSYGLTVEDNNNHIGFYGVDAVVNDLTVNGKLNVNGNQSGSFEGKGNQTLTILEYGLYRLTLTSSGSSGSSCYLINFYADDNVVTTILTESEYATLSNTSANSGVLTLTCNLQGYYSQYTNPLKYCLEKLA